MALPPVLVSVIVAAHNEAATLGNCLDSLAAQTCPFPLEVIVVDDGSTDATAAVAATRPGVRLLRQPKAGPGVARNYGVREAQGVYVAFLDADCRADPDWLRMLVEDLERLQRNRPIAAIGGLQHGAPDDPPYARQVDAFLRAIGFVGDYVKPHARLRPVGHNASCNVLYRREAYLSVGGFRPGLFPGEDVDLDRRLALAGHELWYTPRAVVRHRRPDTPARFAGMLRAYGRGQAAVVALHGLFRPIHALPFLCAAGLLAGAAGLVLAPAATLGCAAGGLAAPLALARRGRLSYVCTLSFCAMVAIHYVPAFFATLARCVLALDRPHPPA